MLAEKNAGKPAHVLREDGRVRPQDLCEGVSLLDQVYVHDPAKTVAQAVKEAEKTVGAPIALTGWCATPSAKGLRNRRKTPEASKQEKAGCTAAFFTP